jgi:hypothetical protein
MALPDPAPALKQAELRQNQNLTGEILWDCFAFLLTYPELNGLRPNVLYCERNDMNNQQMEIKVQKRQLPIPGVIVEVSTSRHFGLHIDQNLRGFIDYFDNNGSVAIWDKGGLSISLKRQPDAAPEVKEYKAFTGYAIDPTFQTYMEDVYPRMLRMQTVFFG